MLVWWALCSKIPNCLTFPFHFLENVKFEWLLNKKWNSIAVTTSTTSEKMKRHSLESFIYEHYFGYTKTADNKTEEYKLQHPSWKISEVLDYQIDCDFEAMYGKSFSVLNKSKPEAVFIADGSSVGIEWKRTKINLNLKKPLCFGEGLGRGL